MALYNSVVRLAQMQPRVDIGSQAASLVAGRALLVLAVRNTLETKQPTLCAVQPANDLGRRLVPY